MTPQELKQQAHKEFDEKFPRLMVSINESPWDRAERMETDGMIMWKFIESLIDRTVQMTEERIVRELKRGLLNRMMKYDSKDGYSTLHDEILEKVSNDVDDILPLITNNKSDINK